VNLHTDIPTRAELDRLLTSRHPASVALYLPTDPVSSGQAERIELRNLADVAMLIVECARQRKESRGLHYVLDYPKPDDRWLRDTVLSRGDLE